jgi:hypothetical protein
MSENMTVCPECGAEFDTVAQEKDLPLQALGQDCPDCDYSVEVAIINYPDSTFTVVAPALKGDTCKARVESEDAFGTEHCGDDAMIRMQKIGRPIEGRCAEHMGAHREAALDLRNQL